MEIQGNDLRIKGKTGPDKVGTPPKVAPDKADTSSTPKVQGGGEQIALSAKAQNIQKALEVIKATPEVRTEKINRIKQQIANNTFKVDSDVLAERILQEILTESQFLE